MAEALRKGRGWHSRTAETQKNSLKEEGSREDNAPRSQLLPCGMEERDVGGPQKRQSLQVYSLSVTAQQLPQTQKLKTTPIYHPPVFVSQPQRSLARSSAQGLTELPSGGWPDYHLDA